MKYKVGDRVRIKSIDWYNKNKDSNGNVVVLNEVTHFSWREKVRTVFTKDMAKFCGKVVTIEIVWTVNYSIVEGTHRDYFTDEMIEGLVEEEVFYDTDFEWLKHEILLPEGYIFKDKNGHLINTTKIVMEKKKEYPNTFLGCCDVLNIGNLIERGVNGYKAELFDTLQKLYICRDAYWKIAGDEMGLGKPWEPDYNNEKQLQYGLYEIIKYSLMNPSQFAFPTEEMRDAFYENFKEDIEKCKKLS